MQNSSKHFNPAHHKTHLSHVDLPVITLCLRLKPKDQKRQCSRKTTNTGHTKSDFHQNPDPDPGLWRKKNGNKRKKRAWKTDHEKDYSIGKSLFIPRRHHQGGQQQKSKIQSSHRSQIHLCPDDYSRLYRSRGHLKRKLVKSNMSPLKG